MKAVRFYNGEKQEAKHNSYLFTVIMPVYNTGKYLEEAVESLIEQTIGFKKNIQLILVNNATKDNSGEICERYLTEYPENIVYIKLEENCGPSGARNAAIPYIKGKYVNFMDSDDKWEKGAFKNAYTFLEKEKKRIDCIACRMLFYGADMGNHPLDFRFKKTRVVNVYDDYDYLQLHVNSTFFKEEKVKEFHFDETMNHAEDTKYFNQIMLIRGQYGLLNRSVYYYRKRSNSDSLLFRVQNQEDYYTEKIQKSLGFFIDYSLKRYGEVIPYIQNMIIYSLKYRIKEKFIGNPPPELSKKAMSLMSEYLRHVSDEIILKQENVFSEHKLFALSLKYKSDAGNQICCRDGDFYFGHSKIFSPEERRHCNVINIEIKNGMLCLDGRISLPLPRDSYSIVVQTDSGDEIPLSCYELDKSAGEYFLGIRYHEVYGFRAEIPIDKLKSVGFILRFEGERIPLALGFWLVTKLSTKLKNTYCVLGNHIVRYADLKLRIETNTASARIKRELCVWGETLRQRHIRTLIWRLLILLGKMIHRLNGKKWWMFMDRFSAGGDNAEYLFRYVVQQENNNIVPFFCVDKNSQDYKNLKAIGKVIPSNSKIYRMMFALCDMVISSQTFYGTQNTFYWRTEYLKDLFSFKFIYVEHGVIKDNHADTQSNHKKALDMFVTTGIPEYESLLHDYYGYDESVVKLTGLARYDSIFRTISTGLKKNTILLAPTWRQTPNQSWNEVLQQYDYNPSFKDTVFFRFYNSIMTDQRIISKLKQYDYFLELQLHPRIWEQNVDFTECERVRIQRTKISLEDAISETCLLVTDYSSIFFDYTYAGIPVIHAQFDKEAFYSNHLYTRGYFDFERDGFGPVCLDYESTVQAIIKSIENGCVMEEKYQKRADAFYAYRDGNNCERIYREILNLDLPENTERHAE